MTAAMGLNSALIVDSRKRPRELSDQKALSSPCFAVTQALVVLLSKVSAVKAISRPPSLAEKLKGIAS